MDIRNLKTSTIYYSIVDLLYAVYFVSMSYLCLKGYFEGQAAYTMLVSFMVFMIVGFIVRFLLRLIIGVFKGLAGWSDNKAKE